MSTLAQLITRTADRLSMVAGTGVQTYAEDRIAEMINHKFDVLFDEVWWPQFLTWEQMTLDESLGVVTTDLTDKIKRFEDIRIIYIENSHTPVTKISTTTTNPFELGGTVPIHYQALANSVSNFTNKVFKIWPEKSTGDIVVLYRTKPDTFVEDDEVPFDDQALILGSVFDYLEDDGTNPNATQKFQLLFESRVKQLKSMYSSGPISLDPGNRIPNSFVLVPLP